MPDDMNHIMMSVIAIWISVMSIQNNSTQKTERHGTVLCYGPTAYTHIWQNTKLLQLFWTLSLLLYFWATCSVTATLEFDTKDQF